MKEQTMSKVDDQGPVGDSSAAVDESTNSAPTSFTPPDAAGSPPSKSASSPLSDSIPSAGAFCQPRDHRCRLVQFALVDIYGPHGPDLGETEEWCLQKVNAWLINRGKPTVSKATVRRAKRALRIRAERERC
jgi:hypothetical protein